MVGGDPVYGLGKIKLRLLDGTLGNYFNNNISWTFTPQSQSLEYWPWSQPLPSNIQVVKCAMFAQEDGSNDTGDIDISNLDLKVRILNPVGGACSTAGSDAATPREDQSFDWNSMVAFETGHVSGGLGGKCMRVIVTPKFVESTNITAKIMCYGAAIQDDAPY